MLFWISQGCNCIVRLDGIRIRTQGKTTALLAGVIAGTIAVSAMSYALVKNFNLVGTAGLFILGALVIEVVQFFWAKYQKTTEK